MNLLFLCVANSARSQMAEGLARHYLGSRATVHSAGSHPGQLNPLAVEVMKEISIDISSQWSKSIQELPGDFMSKLDFVITLCAEEVCPVVSTSTMKLHCPLKDPASSSMNQQEQLNAFREVRDQIKEKIASFLETLPCGMKGVKHFC